MNVKIIGNSAVISSSLTKAEINLLKKHSPEALELRDDKDKAFFQVGFGPVSAVTQFGVIFNSEDKVNSKVYTTVSIPAEVEDAKNFLAENYGKTLVNLVLVEKAAGVMAKAVVKDIKTIAETITEISVTE